MEMIFMELSKRLFADSQLTRGFLYLPPCPLRHSQPCPESDKGFREQQCSHFDSHKFKSKQYTWEPFIKGKVPYGRCVKCADI